jgi:hypothetical protein
MREITYKLVLKTSSNLDDPEIAKVIESLIDYRLDEKLDAINFVMSIEAISEDEKSRP